MILGRCVRKDSNLNVYSAHKSSHTLHLWCLYVYTVTCRDNCSHAQFLVPRVFVVIISYWTVMRSYLSLAQEQSTHTLYCSIKIKLFELFVRVSKIKWCNIVQNIFLYISGYDCAVISDMINSQIFVTSIGINNTVSSYTGQIHMQIYQLAPRHYQPVFSDDKYWNS